MAGREDTKTFEIKWFPASLLPCFREAGSLFQGRLREPHSLPMVGFLLSDREAGKHISTFVILFKFGGNGDDDMSDSTNDRNDLFEHDPEPYYDDEYYDEDDDDWDGMDDYYEDDCDCEDMPLLEYMESEKIPGWLIAIVSFYIRVRNAYKRLTVKVPF